MAYSCIALTCGVQGFIKIPWYSCLPFFALFFYFYIKLLR